MLRFVVAFLLAAAPASQPATRSTAAFASLKSLLSAIPRDVEAPAGQDWTAANYKIINDWCAQNLIGAEFNCVATLKASNASAKRVYFEFRTDGASANNVNVKRANLQSGTIRSDEKAIAQLPVGSVVTLKGTVAVIRFRAYEKKSQELNMLLDNLEVTTKRH